MVEPLALAATLYPDEQLTQTLWISNVGNMSLIFQLDELSHTLDYDLPWLSEDPLSGTVAPGSGIPITVRIIRGHPELIMVIEDDGIGFSPDSEESRGKGLGIISMRERLEGMGGRFKIYSSPGRGTRIRASIPMKGQDDGRSQGTAG